MTNILLSFVVDGTLYNILSANKKLNEITKLNKNCVTVLCPKFAASDYVFK